MSLATVSAAGRPSNRFVLLKGYDADGFKWYTNYGSRKGSDLSETGRAAIAFWWPGLERQVRDRLDRQCDCAFLGVSICAGQCVIGAMCVLC